MKVKVLKTKKASKTRDTFEVARKEISAAIKKSGVNKRIKPSKLDIAYAYSDISIDEYNPMKSLNKARVTIGKIKLKPGFKKYKSSELDISNAY